MNDYNYNVVVKENNEMKVDKVISKKLLQHLMKFLSVTEKTRKKKKNKKKNITQKNNKFL